MLFEVTLDELRAGVRVPLDERHTIRLLPNAIVEVRTPDGEPVLEEPVLVKRSDGKLERHKTNALGNVYLYGAKNEVFNVTLLGRPTAQLGEAVTVGESGPCAVVQVNNQDGAAVRNQEVLVQREDGREETYFTNGEGKVRLFGEPGEALKVALANQLKGSVRSGESA